MKDKFEDQLSILLKQKLTFERFSSIDAYLKAYRRMLEQTHDSELFREMVSGYNRLIRKNDWSSTNFNVEVKVGDICFVDFGHSYINEVAYQHCALIVSMFNYKAFVIPMTSNLKTLAAAKNICEDGKEHLYYIGKIEGLNKPSVLFLNDAQYINTARIISKSSHIDPDSQLFEQILLSIKRCIFSK